MKEIGKMIYLEYCNECLNKNGKYLYQSPLCLSDFDINDFSQQIQDIIQNNSSEDIIIPCSNNLPFLIVRKLIAKDIIKSESIAFIYGDKIIKLNQYGSMLETRIPSINSDLTQEILEIAANKYKKNESLEIETEIPLMV